MCPVFVQHLLAEHAAYLEEIVAAVEEAGREFKEFVEREKTRIQRETLLSRVRPYKQFELELELGVLTSANDVFV